MTFKEFNQIGEIGLRPIIQELYGLVGYDIKMVDRGYDIFEGQNAVYYCEKEGNNGKIFRLSLNDRSREELLAEAGYIRYLYENGGNVSNVITSLNGNLVEEITLNNITGFVGLFEKAKGMQFHENGYHYREGVPISEYYFNIGKTIGKIHYLSKKYESNHQRCSFFDKYNTNYINELIPGSFSLLKSKLNEIWNTLEQLGNNREIYGMIHLDYNDSNYSIDFETGQLTVYDFDNSCFGWYLYDLAFNWMYAVGYAQHEKDSETRKKIMDDYFNIVLKGYRTETGIEDWLLEKFPFFIDVVIMALIIEAFEYIRSNNKENEYDFELSYLIKCIEDGIPYMGFFHDIYSCEKPFEYEDERIKLFISTLTG